jgi:uncharacterized secreted protein with C-terminal beta-propeller domain
MSSSIDMNNHLRIALAVCMAATALTAGTITYAMTKDGGHSFSDAFLQPFYSYDELKEFLADMGSYGDSNAYYGSPTLSPDSMGKMTYDQTPTHSTTNIQVAGVDEDDIVKTDGEYLYIASYDKVTVVKAYPSSDLANVTVLDIEDILGFKPENASAYISGIYLYDTRLIVVLSAYEWWNSAGDYAGHAAYQWSHERAMVSVFDIKNVSAPKLLFSHGVSGYALTSRMVGSYVYLVGQSSILMLEQQPFLPLAWDGNSSKEVNVGDIYYDPETRDASVFMNLLAVDVVDGDHATTTLLAGYASTVYMSLDAMYLSVQKWSGEMVVVETDSAPENEVSSRTTIYKVAVDKLTMVNVARGDVSGWLLNQFSMDEKDGYLRVATTTGWSIPESAVYVLDSDLAIFGSLTKLAPNERIYSARFLGDTLYMVTFRQIDPFFVIDLDDPAHPWVVGELKNPGFSSYLHPVDEDHVLGIGSENGSVKISLYNVSDPTNPTEQSKCLLPYWSSSSATYDPKAVLFDFEKGLLVIPVSISSYEEPYNNWTYWSGAYLFDVSTDKGVSVKGTVAHGDTYGYDSVLRALYIEDTLYTVSQSRVKATSLLDISQQGELIYNISNWWYYYAYSTTTG